MDTKKIPTSVEIGTLYKYVHIYLKIKTGSTGI